MNLIHELNKGILKWYTFSLPCKVLCIGSELDSNNPIAECLIEMGTDCFYLPMKQINEESFSFQKEKYDYAVLIGSIEYARNPTKFLSVVRESLKSGGVLLIGSDNRLGIRYFCGDRDPFTGRNFDSVENYLRINPADRQEMEGRLYSKAELSYILKQAGFGNKRFYSVFPDISRPQVLISEDYVPNEEFNIRIFPQYNYPDTVFLEEESLYSTLLENNMFHSMANGFLIECPLNGVYSNTLQITVSMDRGPENGMCTIIRKDNQVEKRALYKDGVKKLYQLADNNKYLQKHGIHMIDARLDNNSLVMPFVDGIPLVTYFRELIKSDKEKFLSEMDNFWNLIKNSSEHVPYDQIDWECFEPGWEHRKADDPKKDKWRKIAFGTLEEQENLGVILKRGYIEDRKSVV